MGNKGRHKDDPRPIFLKPDKVPTGKNWSKVVPDRKKFRIVRIRCIAFSQNVSIRFYQFEPRPVPEETRLELRAAAKKKLKSVQQENLKATKAKLRKRFRGTKKKAVRNEFES